MRSQGLCPKSITPILSVLISLASARLLDYAVKPAPKIHHEDTKTRKNHEAFSMSRKILSTSIIPAAARFIPERARRGAQVLGPIFSTTKFPGGRKAEGRPPTALWRFRFGSV